MHHELKTDPEVFDAVVRGEKTFELRKDDRGYSVGDTLLLRRTLHPGRDMALGKPLEYTGEQTKLTVSHLLRGTAYALIEGWVILSFSADTIPAANKSHDVEIHVANKLINLPSDLREWMLNNVAP